MIRRLHKIFLFSVLFFGAILFSEKSFAQPANNNCASATTLVENAACTNGTTASATTEGGETKPCATTGAQTVWYKFVAINTSMSVTVDNLLTGGCHIASGVWDNGTCLPATTLACKAAAAPVDITHNLTTLTIGNTYLISLAYPNGGPCGSAQTFCINVTGTCAAPTISPSSASVCSGGSILLTALSGYTTYQWQSSPDNSTWTNIGGATSSTYTTPALVSTTYYRVNYTLSGCSGSSASVTVDILSSPSITSQPVSTLGCKGGSVIFSVAASPAASTFQWQYYNGATWANVVNGTPANFTYTNATTANLTITTTAAATAGAYQYRCNVTACSSTLASSAATFTLNSPPVAGSITPLSTAGVCGTPVNFTLTLAGGYTGTIQWQRSSDNITFSDIYGATSATYSGTTNSTSYYRTTQTLNGCTSTQSSVATVTFAGTTAKTFNVASGAWGTAANWSPSGVPGTCDDVTVPAGRTVSVALDAFCHSLTVQGTVNITFSSGKYLYVHGNLVNDGTISLSAASGSNPQGQCSPCSGLSLMGQNTTWSGTGTYPLLTVSIGDGSNTLMTDDASIDVLDATKTAAIGKLNLGTKTLKITHAFSQAESEVHVNTGLLWINITSSMLIDQLSLFPEYGTVFNDLGVAATLTISGGWSTIGGTGWYNYEQRATAGAIVNNCSFHCRGYYKIWSGAGAISFAAGGNWTNQIEGDFIHEGTWTHNSTNTILMDGPGPVYNPLTNTFTTSTDTQNITGPLTTAFTNLTINNASTGVQLNGVDASVGNSATTGVLTLTAGPLYLNSKKLTVINANTTAVVRTSGYVVSENNVAVNPSILQWNIGATTGAHVFPFGTAGGSYIPVTFNNSGAVGNVSISTRPTAAADNLPWAGASNVAAVTPTTGMNDNTGTNVSAPSAIDRWWDITSSVASPIPAVTLSLTYRGIENTTTASGNIGIQHWTGSLWNDGKGGAAGTFVDAGVAGVTTGIQTVSGSGFTYFSPYILSKTGAPLFPLPVELLSFTAECKNAQVVAEWSTASELNNDYFTLEKSFDGTNFYSVEIVEGAGTSNSIQKYSAVDADPCKGTCYYRLRQTDYNGQSETFNTIVVEGCGNKNGFAVYPNPASGVFNVSISAKHGDEVLIVVKDLLGQEFYSQVILLSNDQETIAIDPSGKLAAGVYFVLAASDDAVYKKKLVIK